MSYSSWAATCWGVVFWCASVALASGVTSEGSRRLPLVDPAEAQMSARQLAMIDQVVAEGLAKKRMPGCVVAIGRKGKLVLLKAYGDRQIEPRKVAMTTDTIFDLASLTKPLATATSVMKLIEQGKVRLHDRVATYLPEFGQNDKDRITIYHLLTHQGGLIPDNALSDYQDGPETAWARICALKPRSAPGTRFVYTDVGYIVLGTLVQRLSGQRLDAFAATQFYRPLGMRETGFLPDATLRERAAVTQQREDRWMQGEVHDPRAYRLSGVAGHAGLFSSAEDLALYADMMLRRGKANGHQVLAWRTIDRMTDDYPVQRDRDRIGFRGLGWDKLTGYSSNRGDLFTRQAFGHGGFTGTSMWIDPGLNLFVIFLSNRVHPDGKGSVNRLAGRIGSIAAAAILDLTSVLARPAAPGTAEVLSGIDVLRRDGFRLLEGKRVGLITNQTGIAHDGVTTIKLLHDAPNVDLVTLFSPEHGIAGKLDIPEIGDAQDESTRLKIVSLYGKSRKPTPASLQNLDCLVFDIQDIGTRFYTYISTMGYAMQAAAEENIAFVVLDRPNPINGVDVSGPVLDKGRESFVGFHTIPVRHGMTVGELAEMFRHELKLNVDLTVVKAAGWRRSDYFDRTGLLWVNPSPNMRCLNQAFLYPGVGLLETTNVSVGRGTDTPFELMGAPWIDAQRLAATLNGAGLSGVRFVPRQFTPDASKFADQLCGGTEIVIVDRQRCDPLAVGFAIARQLRLLYPDQWDSKPYDRLLGNRTTLEAILAGKSLHAIEAGCRKELDRFLVRRAAWLLYE